MTEDEPGQDPKSPQDARLASLDERLARAQAEEAARSGKAGRAVPRGYVQGVAHPVGPGRLSARLRADRLCDRSVGRDARDLGGDAVRWASSSPCGKFGSFQSSARNERAEGRLKSGGGKQNRPDAPVPDQPARGQSGRQPVRLHQQRLVDADRPRPDLAVHARRHEARSWCPAAGRSRSRASPASSPRCSRPMSGRRGANMCPGCSPSSCSSCSPICSA